MLQKNAHPSDEVIRSGLELLRLKREERVEHIVQHARLTQRLQMLENGILRFIQLTLSIRYPPEFVLARMSSLHSSAPRLDALKLPSKPGSSGFDDELVMKPRGRNLNSTLLLIFVFSTIVILTHFVPAQLAIREILPHARSDRFWGPSFLGQSERSVSTNSMQWNARLYSAISASSLSVMWSIESYRVVFTMTPLSR